MNRLLVVTSVHPPDDPRIRYKHIESLAGEWAISYAAPDPGPTSTAGFVWTPLRGRRWARSARASLLVLRGRYDVASVHDPELLPATVIAALIGRRVAYDVHEDLVAQLRTRPGVPDPVRRVLAAAARTLLRIAASTVPLTLAEVGYASSLGGEHPVFPNLLEEAPLPEPGDGGNAVVYLGDVTEARGALVLLDAVAAMATRVELHLAGRCRPDLEARLRTAADTAGVRLTMHGYLDRAAALELITRCRVGVAPLLDLPNYRHSMPTKLIEYLAMGIPVVASDLPGTRRLAADLPGTVLVPPGDADALAAALDRVFAGGGTVAAARAGAAAVRRDHRWPADEVRAFYASLLHRPGRGRRRRGRIGAP